jgi:hypothetical protein
VTAGSPVLLEGFVIYTTAQIVVGELPGVNFLALPVLQPQATLEVSLFVFGSE